MKKHFAHRAGLLAAALTLLTQSASAADPLPRIDPARAGFSASSLERIDRFFADEISRDRIPGAVVAVAREGKLVYFKAIGFQDKAANQPMQTDAIFALASMTKPMMATIVTVRPLTSCGSLNLVNAS